MQLDLDLAADGRAGSFVLGPGLLRHDGALYGGTGLAVSVRAMEAATQRTVLWASTQFVSSPRSGARIEWTTEVLAEGKRSAQLLVRARVGDQLAFTAIGSCGVLDPDGLTGQYRSMPDVAGPDDAPPRENVATSENPDSYTRLVELRQADGPELGDPRTYLWARLRDGSPFTPATIAFAADFVPLAVARAAGKLGAGSSLDNSMRFHGDGADGWILLDLQADLANGGYGHGLVHVWSQDGRLLATGSQSAAMRYTWDPGEPMHAPQPR